MTPKDQKVLNALAECSRPDGEECQSFVNIAHTAKMEDIAEVRRIVRRLKRKGLAEFHFPLWSVDGEPRGAGYCISTQGIAQASP